MSLDDWKNVAQILQGSAAFGAAAVGAWWWIHRRMWLPRANIKHSVSHHELSASRTLVRIAVTIENCGDVRIYPESLHVRISQVRPLHSSLANTPIWREGGKECEGDWPIIAERTKKMEENHEIEPGETDEHFFDFELAEKPDLIVVYSHFPNRAKSSDLYGRLRDIGWNVTTSYE